MKTKKGQKGFYSSYIYSDVTVPENQAYILNTATTNWRILEQYEAYIPCKNRFITALRALLTGKVKWEWQVEDLVKDKRLKITGKRKDDWRSYEK